jgi:hypothetical protein
MDKRDLDVYLLAAQQYRHDRRPHITSQDNWEVGPHGLSFRVGVILGDSLGNGGPTESDTVAIGKRLVDLGFFRHYPGRNRDGYYTLTPRALPCSTASS